MVEDESRGAFEEREDGKGGIVPPDFVMHIPELRWRDVKPYLTLISMAPYP